MTIVRHDVEIEDWPVLPTTETNRQRVIRALREADGVVEQCRVATHKGDERCAIGIVIDLYGLKHDDHDAAERAAGLTERGETRIWENNDDGLTFAQIADHLEGDDSYWNEKAEEPYEGES